MSDKHYHEKCRNADPSGDVGVLWERRMFVYSRVKQAPTQFEHIVDEIFLSHLDEGKQNEELFIIDEHAYLFHWLSKKFSAINAVEYTLHLTVNVTIRVKIHQYSPCQRDEIDGQTVRLLKQGIICPWSSSY